MGVGGKGTRSGKDYIHRVARVEKLNTPTALVCRSVQIDRRGMIVLTETCSDACQRCRLVTALGWGGVPRCASCAHHGRRVSDSGCPPISDISKKHHSCCRRPRWGFVTSHANTCGRCHRRLGPQVVDPNSIQDEISTCFGRTGKPTNASLVGCDKFATALLVSVVGARVRSINAQPEHEPGPV